MDFSNLEAVLQGLLADPQRMQTIADAAYGAGVLIGCIAFVQSCRSCLEHLFRRLSPSLMQQGRQRLYTYNCSLQGGLLSIQIHDGWRQTLGICSTLWQRRQACDSGATRRTSNASCS